MSKKLIFGQTYMKFAVPIVTSKMINARLGKKSCCCCYMILFAESEWTVNESFNKPLRVHHIFKNWKNLMGKGVKPLCTSEDYNRLVIQNVKYFQRLSAVIFYEYHSVIWSWIHHEYHERQNSRRDSHIKRTELLVENNNNGNNNNNNILLLINYVWLSR